MKPLRSLSLAAFASAALLVALVQGVVAPGAGGGETTPQAGPPEPPPEQMPEHMAVPAEETCTGCHQDYTPEVYEAWYAGRHGLNNVKCFVCHGSTGEDFRPRPPAERCLGCHAAQVESMAGSWLAGKSCFSCHPPHLLSPHDPHWKTELGGEP